MPRILLVEDEADLLLLMQMQLRLAGIESESAATLNEARGKLGNQRFDAILLDILLGEETGWDLVEEFAARPDPHPPIIVISAYVAGDTRERAEAAGCWWLPKPFTPEELKAVLRRVIPGGCGSLREAD